MLGTGYMTAFVLRSSILDLLPTLMAALAGMAAAAAYVSLINDLTDINDDATAGKHNRLAQRRRPYVCAALAADLALGAGVAIVAWRDDPLALGLYAGPWLAFSLYSIQPVRLKARGAAGVLADASGAHLFPAALIVVAVFHAADRRLDGAWLAAVGAWAVAAGIRGALWHQLGDIEPDNRSGVNTFGRLHPRRARWAGRAAFAIELAAFLYLLWRAGSPIAFALLIPYVLLELARVHLWGVRLVVVSRAPLFRIAMHEYYLVLYPLAFLAASTIRHPRDVVVVVFQVALFSSAPRVMGRDAKRALTQLAVVGRTATAPPGRSPS
jgi:4-hydroxybenzoate polyprenyltransferase